VKAPSPKQPTLIAPGETLGVIGAGVMGRTLLHGLFDSGALSRDQAWAAAKSQSSCDAAADELRIPVLTDFRSRVAESGLILICVKPKQAASVTAKLKEAGLRRDTLLISILAGTTIAQLESVLETENPWIRAMPNTPCVVREGITVICPGTYATADHMCRAQRIFEAVGQCLPAEESYFNAITALSGSGPAYQYLIM
jgi:pyrroline-5-carboxylate reductase